MMRLLMVMVALLAMPAQAEEDVIKLLSKPFIGVPVEITPVTRSIHLITGPGGNSVAVIGEKGTLLVDSGVSLRAVDLERALTAKHFPPVDKIITTHHHFDHSGGNAYFAAHGATIIAQEHVRMRLRSPQKDAFSGFVFPATPEAALPSVTYMDEAIIRHENHALLLEHPVNPAHTDGDTFVRFEQANVIVTGDLFSNGYYPFIDYGVGGWTGGMIVACDRMLELADAQTIIIPGHGPVATREDLQAYRDMLAGVQARVRPLVEAGKSEAATIAAKPTADYDAKWGKAFFNGDQFTKMVYWGLKENAVNGD